MSLVLERLRVRSLDTDYNEVSWNLESSRIDVLDYTFQILRSESEAGPFEPISPGFKDRYVFIDQAIRSDHRWRTYFYVLRITHDASGKIQDSVPVSKEPEVDLVAAEIRRHFSLLMVEHAGRRCWVLPIRTFGQFCTCYNETLQEKVRTGCRLCWDTNFIRGYLSPIEAWIQFDPSPKATQIQGTGNTQQVNTSARLGYFPMIKPNDVIVEGENRRWRVITVSQTEHGRARVHQELSLHEIPTTDVEYAIPLDLGVVLRDIRFSPSRNFSNPANLSNLNADEDLPDFFSLYPSFYPPQKR